MLKNWNTNIVRLLEIILAYHFVSHIIAGVMLSIGLARKDQVSDTWLNKVPEPLPPGTVQTDIDSVDANTLYIHAIYFAANTISHVAIGDLTPVTTSERALNAFIIWLLTFFYAMLFANIGSVFKQGNNFLSFH